MLDDLTSLDSLGYEALKKALNQRVVVNKVRLLPSSVNRVWLVETDVRPIIVKKFLSRKAGNEFEALIKAKSAGLAVPLPLWKEGDYLVLEYIHGETCDRMINHMFSAEVAAKLGLWLGGFHGGMNDGGPGTITGDAALSNFILFEGAVYGVDLEDSREGEPLEDVGDLAASILGSEPFFTPIKFDLCFRMIRAYERSTGVDAMEQVRPYIARHLRKDAKNKPLFRRTLVGAAKSLERGWPRLA